MENSNKGESHQNNSLDRCESQIMSLFDVMPGEDCSEEDEAREYPIESKESIKDLNELFIRLEREGYSIYDETAYEVEPKGKPRSRKNKRNKKNS